MKQSKTIARLKNLFSPEKSRRNSRSRRFVLEPLEQRVLLSAVTGLVFEDPGADGQRDDTDRPISGFPIHLWGAGVDVESRTSDDVLLESLRTTQNGDFSFDVEVSGSYYLQFGTQAGLTPFTRSNVGTSGQIQSHADTELGLTTIFSTGGSDPDKTFNAGIVQGTDLPSLNRALQDALHFAAPREDYIFDIYGEQEKWLVGQPGTFSRVYFLNTEGDLYNWDGQAGSVTGEFVAHVGVDTYATPSLLHNAEAVDKLEGKSPADVAYLLDKSLGLRAREIWFDSYADLGVRWILGGVNEFGNQWYFIRPDGDFWAWNGVREQASGTRITTLTSDYYDDPVVLTNAQRPDTRASSESIVKDAFGITEASSRPDSVIDTSHAWFIGSPNEFGNNRYFVTQTGEFVAWDGTEQATGRSLASLSTTLHSDTSILLDALAPVDGQSPQARAFDLRTVLDLETPGWYFRDWAGAGEVWLQGTRNIHGNYWYFVLPNGDFYSWDGAGKTATGARLTTVSPLANTLPWVLHAALPPTVAELPDVSDDVVQLSSVSPKNGEQSVNVNRETVIRFNGEIDPTTINANTFRAEANGQTLAGRVVVSSMNKFATLFYDSPLPASTGVRVVVDTENITDIDGNRIHTVGQATEPNFFTSQFRTLSLMQIPGTEVFGFVKDSETGLPIEGVTISLDAMPEVNSVTNASGFFELGTQDLNNDGISDGVPSPEFFVHIDGSTATTETGRKYAGLGKPFHATPGQRDQLNRAGNIFDIFLPAISDDAFVEINPDVPTVVGFGNTDFLKIQEMFPAVDPAVLKLMQVRIPVGSAVNDLGEGATTAFIVPVAPEFLPAPLPPNLDPKLVVSVQTPGATNFDVPATVTFPNLDEMGPGEQMLLFSFDHDAGKFVVNGTATVNSEGTGVTSDVGVGINAPGWHFVQPGTNIRSKVKRPKHDKKKPDCRGIVVDLGFSIFSSVQDVIRLNVPLAAAAVGGVAGAAAGPGGAIAGAQLGFLLAESVAAKVNTVVDGLKDGLKTLSQGHLRGDSTEEIFRGVRDSWADVIRDKVASQINPVVSHGNAWREAIKNASSLGENAAKFASKFDQPAFRQTTAAVHGTTPPPSDLSAAYEAIASEFGFAKPSESELQDFDLFFTEIHDAEGTLPTALQNIISISRAAGIVQSLLDLPAPGSIDLAELETAMKDLEQFLPVISDFNGSVRRTVDELNAIPARSFDSISEETTSQRLYFLAEVNDLQIRGETATGEIDLVLPGNSVVTLSVFEPASGFTGNSTFTVPASGRLIDLPTVVLGESKTDDSDGDGLPDDAEAIIGTSISNADTDNDGITDAAEIAQGLDPLGGRAFPTGVIASLPLSGEAHEIVVTGNAEDPTLQTAYIATGSHGLAIVDVSEFDNPIVLGQLKLNGGAIDVAVDTQLGLAAVATGIAGLQIVDVSDSLRPTVIDIIPFNAQHVEISEGMVLAVSRESAVQYDLASGEILSETEIGQIEDLSLARHGAVVIQGRDLINFAISADGLTEIGRVEVGGSPSPETRGKQVFIGDEVAYVGFFRGYAVIDNSNPAIPVITGTPSRTQSAVHGLAANGSGLLLPVTSFNGPLTLGLSIYDVSDPADVSKFLTSVDTPGNPTNVTIASGIAYVADGNSGLAVVNYLPFDSLGLAPVVAASIDTATVDTEPQTDGTQVPEGFRFPIFASVTDDVQVRNVELLIDGVVTQNAVSYPFNLLATAPVIQDGAAVGEFQVQIRATDTGGNTTLSDALTIQIVPDTTPPVVGRFEPVVKDADPNRTGTQITEGRDIPIRFSVSDLGGVDTVELLQDGEVIQSQQRASGFFVAIAGQLHGGETKQTIELQLRATDRAGNVVTTDAVRFEIVPDTISPSIANINLTQGDIKPQGLFALNITFDEAIDATLITDRVIQLVTAAGTPVAQGSFHVFDRRISATYDLENAESFTLSIDAASIVDLAGNTLGVSPQRIEFSAQGSTRQIFDGRKFGAGDQPLAVVDGDFNGDGIADLATASFRDSAVSILVGRDDGTFATEIQYPVGSGVRSLTTGDFNNDGVADIAAANSTSDDLSILLGKGDGTFETEQRFTTGTLPFAIETADFNGDGNADVSVANFRSDNVSVLLGNGDGTFSDQQQFEAGDGPSSLTVGDFNADGLADIVAANSFFSDDVSILFGVGDGTFSEQVRISADDPDAITSGDFNGDGFQDLATVSQATNLVSVLDGIGDGTFAPPRQFSVGDNPNSVTAGDFNGDGITDFATAHKDVSESVSFPASYVSILLGAGDGGFGTFERVAAGQGAGAIISVDFDGDGDADIATANAGSGDVSVLINRGGGDFGSQRRFGTGQGPLAVTQGDFNRDGSIDIATANGLDVSVLVAQGDGNFAPELRYGARAHDIVTADFDGDGIPDIMTANRNSNDASLLLGNGDGSFSVPRRVGIFGLGPQSIVTVDFNNDGIADLATGNLFEGSDGTQNSISILLGVGDGTFLHKTVQASAGSLATGDLDGDGIVDLVSTYLKTVSVHLGSGDGTFGDGVQSDLPSVSQGTESVDTADLNGDGILDLVTANGWRSSSVSVLLGLGDGTFSEPQDFSSGDGPHSVAIGDFDSDGIIDIASANRDSNDVSILLGIGDGTFSPEQRFNAGIAPWSLRTGDYNSDGLADLAIANTFSDDVMILLNQLNDPL